jgi:hypothetical protein
MYFCYNCTYIPIAYLCGGEGTCRDTIIAIGTSAGGVEALVKLVGQFPEDLPASVFIVLHIPAHRAQPQPHAGYSHSLRASCSDAPQ